MIRRMAARCVVAGLLVAAAAGCAMDPCGAARPGAELTCPPPGDWFDRPYDLYVPASWDGAAPLPLVVAFHGGGGNRSSAQRVTCPTGDPDEPGCLSAAATARGYAVVLPSGTGTRPLRNVRTWNAGGGRDGWQCVSGGACQAGVDDLAYLDDLLADVGRVVPLDPSRVFATGLSNGAAISHRAACERPDRIAAIAAVGGANQHVAAGGACAAQVPVLQIHGTEDPCWTFRTGTAACLERGDEPKVGGLESTESWRQRNGCGETPVETSLADVDPGDGTTAVLLEYPGCAADVTLLRIDGGGHTWPRGWPYFDEEDIGRTSQDVDANALILDFFDAHPRP